MKHPTQISEETVNRFINESMKTKTMMEAKKKAKKSKAEKPKTRDYDYSDEEGAGKRERQEMQGDHQEHEGELQNELSAFMSRGAASLARMAQDKAQNHGWGGNTPESIRKGRQADRLQSYSDAEYRKRGSGTAWRNVTKRSQERSVPGSSRIFPPGSGEVAGARVDAANAARNARRVRTDNQKHEGELHNEDLKGAAKTVKDKLVRGKRVANVVVQRKLKPWLKKQGDALNQSAKQEADDQMYGDLPNYP